MVLQRPKPLHRLTNASVSKNEFFLRHINQSISFGAVAKWQMMENRQGVRCCMIEKAGLRPALQALALPKAE